MTYATFMEVLNARDKLLIKLASLFLRQALMFDNIIEKFSACGILHDHEEILFCLNDLRVKLASK
jgi:hypothetical protein